MESYKLAEDIWLERNTFFDHFFQKIKNPNLPNYCQIKIMSINHDNQLLFCSNYNRYFFPHCFNQKFYACSEEWMEIVSFWFWHQTLRSLRVSNSAIDIGFFRDSNSFFSVPTDLISSIIHQVFNKKFWNGKGVFNWQKVFLTLSSEIWQSKHFITLCF